MSIVNNRVVFLSLVLAGSLGLTPSGIPGLTMDGFGPAVAHAKSGEGSEGGGHSESSSHGSESSSHSSDSSSHSSDSSSRSSDSSSHSSDTSSHSDSPSRSSDTSSHSDSPSRSSDTSSHSDSPSRSNDSASDRHEDAADRAPAASKVEAKAESSTRTHPSDDAVTETAPVAGTAAQEKAAALLGNLNAAHASETARRHAAETSMVGRIADYETAMRTALAIQDPLQRATAINAARTQLAADADKPATSRTILQVDRLLGLPTGGR